MQLNTLSDRWRRRGRLFRLVLVGVAAYIVGAKAGRGRYEQIRRWYTAMMDRLHPSDHVDTSSPGIGPKANPLTETGIRPTNNRGSMEAGASR